MTLSNSGKEECIKCHGAKYGDRQIISLISVCNHCGGWGYVDWIDNMTGNPSLCSPDLNLKSKIAMQNVQMLMTEIKSILHATGIQAVVTVEQIMNHNHNSSLYHASVATDGKLGYHTHHVCADKNILLTI